MSDICILYDCKDGQSWYDHFVHKLQESYSDLSVYPVDIAGFVTKAPEDKTLSDSIAGCNILFIIASPGFHQELINNPAIPLDKIVVDVQRSLLLLCGIELEDLHGQDLAGVQLYERFPQLEQWKQGTCNDWKSLSDSMIDLIKKGRTKKRSLTHHARKRKREFKLVPTEVYCEVPTVVYISFDDVVASSESEIKVDVIVSDCSGDSQDDGKKLPAIWINPCTFSFVASEHAPGEVRVRVVVMSKSVGSGCITYRPSVLTDVVQGLTKIHVHQLSAILNSLEEALRRGSGGVTTGRGGAQEGSVWETVDRELSSVFADDDDSNIPVQAFEQMFAFYNYVQSENSSSEYPNMLYIAARYGLKELASKLIGLPDSSLAYSVMNARGMYPENVAREKHHDQLATMFENFREVGDPFEKLKQIYSKYINGNRSLSQESDEYIAPDGALPSWTRRKDDGSDDSEDYVDIPPEAEAKKKKVKPLNTNTDGNGNPEMYLELVAIGDTPPIVPSHSDRSNSASPTNGIRPPQLLARGNAANLPTGSRNAVAGKKEKKLPQDTPAYDAKVTEHLANMPANQRELIRIMEMVKAKQLNQDEADLMFKSWKLQYQGQGSTFKQKEHLLAELRIEAEAAENHITTLSSVSALSASTSLTLGRKIMSAVKSSFGRSEGKATNNVQNNIKKPVQTAADKEPATGSRPLKTGRLDAVRDLSPNRHGDTVVEYRETDGYRASTISTSSSSSRDSVMSNASRNSFTSGIDADESVEDTVSARGHQAKVSRSPQTNLIPPQNQDAQNSIPPVPPRASAVTNNRYKQQQSPLFRLPPLQEDFASRSRSSGADGKNSNPVDVTDHCSGPEDNYEAPDAPIGEENGEEDELYFVPVATGFQPAFQKPKTIGKKQMSMPEASAAPSSMQPRKVSNPEITSTQKIALQMASAAAAAASARNEATLEADGDSIYEPMDRCVPAKRTAPLIPMKPRAAQNNAGTLERQPQWKSQPGKSTTLPRYT